MARKNEKKNYRHLPTSVSASVFVFHFSSFFFPFASFFFFFYSNFQCFPHKVVIRLNVLQIQINIYIISNEKCLKHRQTHNAIRFNGVQDDNEETSNYEITSFFFINYTLLIQFYYAPYKTI